MRTATFLGCATIAISPFLGDGSVWVLRHSGEVDCDLATLQDPTVREAHFGRALICNHLDSLYDHQRFRGFSPKRYLDRQSLEAENSAKMFAQLLPSFEILRRTVIRKTADQEGVGSVLVEYPFDIFLENQVYMLPVHAPQGAIRDVLFCSLRECLWHRSSFSSTVWPNRGDSSDY